MNTITVLGADGFIGSHLVRRIEALGLDHRAPRRDEDLRGRDLGSSWTAPGSPTSGNGLSRGPLASVYGPDLRSRLFVASVLREVVATGELTLRTAPESSRDYVSVYDVVECPM
ncbi:MAG: hypothetical protein H0V55_07135 [Thermoleophilaceae bacterium]|nr:hypothetical protein [Thermoleophilaceae bacterium]